MSIRPGPRPTAPNITEAERQAFRQLYRDGAWTLWETEQHFRHDHLMRLIEQRYLMGVQHDLGRMVFLLALGRIAAFGACDKPEAISRQLDRAYLRLAIKKLGWTPLPDGPLAQYDTTGRMWEVMTPGGAALVTGVYGVGLGYTREGLQRLITRLRSTALYRGFRVIVLTPSARRGQKLAAHSSAWMHLVPCQPASPLRRLQRQEGRLAVRNPPQPLDPSGHAELVHEAHQGLLIDTVLSGRQLRRWYGLDNQDLVGVPYVEVLIRPVHGQASVEVPTRMYLSDARLHRLPDHALAHRAGVAEIRRQLNVTPLPGDWAVEARGHLTYEEPDAVWRSPEGDVAIEYDTGSYTRITLNRKLGKFQDRGFERTVLGVPSRRRAARLTEQLDVEVRVARWFDLDS